MSDREDNVAERLMGALISKMENMDSNLQILKAENEALKGIVSDPAALLRKAGFVSRGNSAPHDVLPDLFRGDAAHDILKDSTLDGISIPKSNAEFHGTEWSEIHELAGQARSSGSVGNNVGME